MKWFAKEFSCTVLLKGEIDLIASEDKFEEIKGGNPGMTKGGTGDVLAGLAAALYCVNDPFTSAVAASYINKKAGEELFEKMGYWFNASDLAEQIPITMRKLLPQHQKIPLS
ncbi:hydroxyethylthiazole kinase [Candidatus Gottesmanbacteria bacterium]|nr:hydroxyethylthiazole kinase [Candidatus Gottesmanbacteria bacterium]